MEEKELKSRAYDLLVIIERCQLELKQINNELSRINNQKLIEKDKEDKHVDSKKPTKNGKIN